MTDAQTYIEDDIEEDRFLYLNPSFEKLWGLDIKEAYEHLSLFWNESIKSTGIMLVDVTAKL